MRLTADEKVLFPELHRYLRDSMPKCADISVIVNNLVTYGGLSVAEARNCLRFGTDPKVFGVPENVLANHRCARFGHAKCAFSASQANAIELNIDDVNDFVNGMGLGTTASGLAVPIVGVALLHALCHWGNNKNHIKEKAEQGFEFERATYGKVIG